MHYNSVKIIGLHDDAITMYMKKSKENTEKEASISKKK